MLLERRSFGFRLAAIVLIVLVGVMLVVVCTGEMGMMLMPVGMACGAVLMAIVVVQAARLVAAIAARYSSALARAPALRPPLRVCSVGPPLRPAMVVLRT